MYAVQWIWVVTLFSFRTPVIYPQMHVTKGAKPPLQSGYVQTGRHPNMNNYTPTVYALDCEMVSVCMLHLAIQ